MQDRRFQRHSCTDISITFLLLTDNAGTLSRFITNMFASITCISYTLFTLKRHETITCIF